MKYKSLTLKDIQVRYNPNTAEITLTSKDPAVRKRPFIVTLSADSPTYVTLLELLEKNGLADLSSTEISKEILISSPEQTNSPSGSFGTRIRIGESFLNEPVELDLADSPHTLIAGMPGSGKSVLQRLVAAHAHLHKDEIDLYVIDLNSSGFEPYLAKENLATSLDETEKILQKVITSMRGSEGPKVTYLIVDELRSILELNGSSTEEALAENARKRSILESLETIIRLGRSCGVYMFVSTKEPDFRAFGNILDALFFTRILIGSANSTEAHLVLKERAKFGDGLLRGVGRAIVSTKGKQNLTQIYHLDHRQITRTR